MESIVFIFSRFSKDVVGPQTQMKEIVLGPSLTFYTREGMDAELRCEQASGLCLLRAS